MTKQEAIWAASKLLRNIYHDDRENIEMLKNIIPSEDNPHYDKIMNFLNTYNKDEN